MLQHLSLFFAVVVLSLALRFFFNEYKVYSPNNERRLEFSNIRKFAKIINRYKLNNTFINN
jgi:hypothetical protein